MEFSPHHRGPFRASDRKDSFLFYLRDPTGLQTEFPCEKWNLMKIQMCPKSAVLARQGDAIHVNLTPRVFAAHDDHALRAVVMCRGNDIALVERN